ncbi:MAG: zf-HC2 domain-containing protein [bacterium]|nr:zf-HC2 domain-containing protein [bacterium]
MQCEDFRSQLEDYLADSLNEDLRGGFRQHLRGCPQCRQWAVAAEPTLLLMLASPEGETDQVGVDRCVASVSAMIRQDKLTGRIRRRPRPWQLAAAAAAVLFVTVGVWWMNEDASGIAVHTEELTVSEPQAVEEGPEVEFQMDGEGVRIYRLADDEETAVWFVVNPELES